MKRLKELKDKTYHLLLAGMFTCIFSGCELTSRSNKIEVTSTGDPKLEVGIKADSLKKEEISGQLDTALYRRQYQELLQNGGSPLWPAIAEYPVTGALLPYYRVIAFYGNLYSKRMGVLGALPPDEMLDSLMQEVRRWQDADSSRLVKPALHYIAVTAQRDPGKNKKYRLRMPDKEIDKVIEMAAKIDAVVFLDIQIGHSTLEEEIPMLRKYLSMPNVHLGIDPEYAMQGNYIPGRKVGTFDAKDINYASTYLGNLVRELNLPAKILVVHRFTKGMVTNAKEIKISPEVQVVMHMDGFGGRAKKLSSYQLTITKEPVQFTGFKLFYKNDTVDPSKPYVMQPDEILKLYPVPIYIQYQ